MERVHIFEAAGLGKAPFRCIGTETESDRAAVQNERAANGLAYTTNHCTSCDFCSQAIRNAYQILSSDGRRFKVGCDCLRKTGDKGLIKAITEEERAKRRTKAKAKAKARWEAHAGLLDAFKAGQGRDKLATMPHPKGRPDKTALDYVQYCVDNPAFLGGTAYALIEQAIQ